MFKLKKKSVLGAFDLFYCNKLLSVNNFVPILLTKFQYNLYDKNYKILDYFKYINLKNTNLLYLQHYSDFSNFNYLYFLKFYFNLKNMIYFNLYNVIKQFKLY